MTESNRDGRTPSGALPSSHENGPAASPSVSSEAIERLATEFVARVRAAGRRGAAWSALLRDVEGIGRREIVATSEVSRRMAAMRLDAMSGALDSGSLVGRALRDLRAAVESVDPSRFDLASRGGRLLGIVPRGNRLDAYLTRYERTQGRIREIVTELAAGRAELERQNAVVAAAGRSLGTEIEALREYAALAERLEAGVTSLVEARPAAPDAASEARRDELLFAIRRRRQELLTQLAIAMQGYSALEIVEQNNRELIRSVEAATSSTLAALRTGVVVAQALATRERLAENLRRAQEATAAAVGSAGSMRDAGADAGGAVEAAAVDLDALRRAWAEVFAAMSSIERNRLQAAAAAERAERELGERTAG